MGTRRKAREYALQMLYEYDLSHNDTVEIKENFWGARSESEETRQFADELFEGTVQHKDEIDPIIQRQAQNWKIDRMSAVDRNVLRLAVFECLQSETPRVVVINEAIEIARKFGSDESTQFVNGILDGIRKEIEEGKR